MEKLAERIFQLRKERHLTREAVATAIGIAVRTYQRYEMQEREPNATTINLLCDFFGVSADYLLGRTDVR